ncbi:hypothetical protein KI387_039251, partial [Taxus chinensis]
VWWRLQGATEVVDAAVKAGMGPSCDTTGDKRGEGNVEEGGADAEEDIRAR